MRKTGEGRQIHPKKKPEPKKTDNTNENLMPGTKEGVEAATKMSARYRMRIDPNDPLGLSFAGYSPKEREKLYDKNIKFAENKWWSTDEKRKEALKFVGESYGTDSSYYRYMSWAVSNWENLEKGAETYSKSNVLWAKPGQQKLLMQGQHDLSGNISPLGFAYGGARNFQVVLEDYEKQRDNMSYIPHFSRPISHNLIWSN